MAKRYTYTATLTFGDDGEPGYSEVEVTVSYTVAWGEPERGPSYACGGTPAGADEIDDIRLEKVEGKPRPWGMYFGFIANEDDEFATTCVEQIEGSERILAEMMVSAAEQAAEDHAEWLDYRAETMREARYGR